MKLIATLAMAVLVCIVAALWFAESANETRPPQVSAVSSDFEASHPMAGSGESPQREGLRQRLLPSEESTARLESGSGSATSIPVSSAAAAPPRTEPASAPKAGLGQTTGTTSPEPPPIDKTTCEAAARTLSESLTIVDVTPKKIVFYGSGLSPGPPPANSAFTELKKRLLAPLCTGTDAFDRAYPIQSEFVAISKDAYVRILVGDHWISDGTVLSFLSEADQGFFSNSFIHSRRQREPVRSRESFERQLARKPQSLIGGP
jgi:hypothetical protein